VEAAVEQASLELAELLAGLGDEMFAARSLDVKDVGRRLLRILLGLPEMSFAHLHDPVIVAAHDLSPSDTAQMDPQMILGFCTAVGGLTSHTAILARTLGIPAVVGMGEVLFEKLSPGCRLVLDGSAGWLALDPQEETVLASRAAQQRQAAELQDSLRSSHHPAYTADGQRVEVSANIGDLESAREAGQFGAEGVGLLRTEFLYLNDLQPPAEDRQVSIYRSIFEALPGKTVIVRTLDIGGDKPPSYLKFEEEQNPFLGWRAIRICLEETGLFNTQLRAILRAAVGHPVWIMFPMINSLDELECARGSVRQAEQELAEEGLPYAAGLPVGIMVETPAAAVLVDVLAEAADFFSIGTNDLTQYTLAVDRGNPKVAGLYQPLHPAVLRLIRQVIQSAHSRGKWVGMCGELAGMRQAIPILLGLGLDEFSMAARSIPKAKQLIGRLNVEQARQVAGEALSLSKTEQVEKLMKTFLASLSA
jgi:phosphoenolpyruvate-protein phosphotransferase (PTS system enzyme I)